MHGHEAEFPHRALDAAYGSLVAALVRAHVMRRFAGRGKNASMNPRSGARVGMRENGESISFFMPPQPKLVQTNTRCSQPVRMLFECFSIIPLFLAIMLPC